MCETQPEGPEAVASPEGFVFWELSSVAFLGRVLQQSLAVFTLLPHSLVEGTCCFLLAGWTGGSFYKNEIVIFLCFTGHIFPVENEFTELGAGERMGGGSHTCAAKCQQ